MSIFEDAKVDVGHILHSPHRVFLVNYSHPHRQATLTLCLSLVLFSVWFSLLCALDHFSLFFLFSMELLVVVRGSLMFCSFFSKDAPACFPKI